MMISTKGRYALRVMVDLEQHREEDFVSLKDIAERQHISMKYLETIVRNLNKAGLVESQRGKKGGYRMTMPATDCTVADVVRASEGGLEAVRCNVCEGSTCEQQDSCYSLPIWQNLDRVVLEYLSSVSVADVLGNAKRPPITGTGACQNAEGAVE